MPQNMWLDVEMLFIF